METFLSDYVSLRVRARRYLGTWSALQNIIVHSSLLRRKEVAFSVPVKHIKQDDGTPNKFSAVEFKRPTIFTITNGGSVPLPERTIRSYEALTAEMSDNHLAVLHSALTNQGCCREQPLDYYQPLFYKL